MHILVGAIVGGGVNVLQNLSKINDWKGAVGYAVTGIAAGAYAASTGDVHGAAVITIVGNGLTDIATGNVPQMTEISSPAQLAQVGLYSLNLVMGGYGVSSMAAGVVASVFPKVVASSWGTAWSTAGMAGYQEVSPGVWQYFIETQVVTPVRALPIVAQGGAAAAASQATKTAAKSLADDAAHYGGEFLDDGLRMADDVAAGGSQGGLNLFKWGSEQTGKVSGWKTGDYMLHLPNKGTPKSNWKANYGALRREMGLGNPIFDSYRLSNGNLVPTKGFLNIERSILQGRGWTYRPSIGAWFPPRI